MAKPTQRMGEKMMIMMARIIPIATPSESRGKRCSGSISSSCNKGERRGCARRYHFKKKCGDGCMMMSSGKRRVSSTKSNAKRMISILLCAALSVVHVAVEASSNSGTSSTAPFMVTSEIIVQSSESEGDNTIDAKNNNVQSSSSVGNNQNNDVGTADSANVVSAGTNDENYGEASSSIGTNTEDVKTTGEQNILSGSEGSSGSDTDGEDDDKLDNAVSSINDIIASQGKLSDGEQLRAETASAVLVKSASSESTATASQPLRTLKRLQAMLDDTDYATHTVAPETKAAIASTINNMGDNVENNAQAKTTSTVSSQEQNISPPTSTTNNDPNSTPEKLWTSKDRAKYRRTRRTEKQRQQQQAYEEQHARKIRDIQRQRIIREERERKELEELHRKQQSQVEAPDFTDDDTDTDGGGGSSGNNQGFELPNLPVYLSDAELTDDFSEETDMDDAPKMQQRPIRPIYVPPRDDVVPSNPTRQGVYPQMPPRQNMGQNMAQPYHHNYPDSQQQQPPPQANDPYQNFQHQYPPYSQQQQQMPQQYQYGHNTNQQQMQEKQRQYDQQYAAWAQAAANGYYYPPPPHPSTGTSSFQQQFQQAQEQTHQQQSQQQQGQQQQPPYTNQYPYATQQQNQGASYGAQHPQHPYHARQLHQQGGQPYSSIPPQQRASFQPRPQASQGTAAHQGISEQRGFFARENKVPPQQEQQEDGSQSSNSEAALATAESTELEPMTVPVETETTTLETISNTTTSSSISGQMGVKSALMTQTSPLISPMPLSDRTEGPINAEGPYCELDDESAVMIAGTESRISFDSIQKLAFSTIGVALLSYCAVSPRSLPFPEYNRLFLQNLSIVWLAAIAPVFSLLAVYDGKYNNINTAIGTFHVSFTLGYALAFVSEIVVTTAVRLGVFKIWEPAIFSLTPAVPSIILPWVLREKQYKPKRITLFAADFGASCIASPIIEEYLKLKVVQWTCKLPRNFKHNKKVQKSRKRRKQNSLQPVRSIDAPQVTNINCYVTQMLAASLGLKLVDVTRRILMYTKETDDYKRIYAVCRGTFPIHELCGTMTALLLARRDVIGINLPMWKILGPAVFIHGMANFRGMKPIFKWNSSTPWSEMQLNQLKKGNDFIWKQLLPQSYSKIVWMTILFRVFGFCIKNYYLLRRQAMKRTTTYSGKLHAFNAKLHTDAMLKRAN